MGSRGQRPVQETILDAVDRNALEHPGVTATVDGANLLNWSQYRQRARAIALGLLDLGVGRGEVVGLHLCNRAEHVLSDVGALMAGATPASFYLQVSDELLVYLATDCAVTVVIVDADQLPRWQAIRGRVPSLRHVVALDLCPDEPTPQGVLRFEHWVEDAEHSLTERGAEVDATREKVQPDDVLTIAYTSGTTGPPKGTLITHAGTRWMLDELSLQAAEYLGGMIPVGWTTVSYLPLAHMGERIFSHYLALIRTLTVTYVRDPLELRAVLPVARPYLFLGMPRVWERIHQGIHTRVAESRNPARRALGAVALSVARSAGQAALDRTETPAHTRALYPLMERLVFQRLRAALGLDRTLFAVTGVAPISTEVSMFFAGIGIPLIEVYGMTESGRITMSPFDAPRLGTVGRPGRDVALRIAEDGEILVKGPGVTPGYLNRPEATAEAIDADGWLHTGDLGSLDADGYLRVIGRKKEIIVLSIGPSISPANVEKAVADQSELIGSVFVHGEGRPALVALVALDPMGWRPWCEARGLAVGSVAEAASHEQVRSEVERSVAAGNAVLSRFEQVRGWMLVDELWTSMAGELTPTLKLKRSVLAERYGHEIEALHEAQLADSPLF
ncbi:AMP-dependent synthetase/ligase [Pseudonocardia spinosispora]|uniref:AMP-dependent synthetase/ligase n=1 Tax=Pseudonocardia spinosispora TaxID=103441 RepID=UPI00041B61EB|nr:long-chain fatty acid--CoA ligase [Pseudonocardia spinosispora]